MRKLASAHKEKASWKDPSLCNLFDFLVPWQDQAASVLSPSVPQRCPMDPLSLEDEARDTKDEEFVPSDGALEMREVLDVSIGLVELADEIQREGVC